MYSEKEIHFTSEKRAQLPIIWRVSKPVFNAIRGVLVFLLCHIGVGSAQEYAFRNYSIGQGLSESVVNTLIQDEKGYIWMGTGFGLNRFDGHDFIPYFQEDGLKSAQINTLYKDEGNKLWIGTSQGLHWYSQRTDSIHYVSNVPAKSIISIFEDSQNRLWLGTEEEGIYMYTPKPTKALRHLNPATLTFNGPVRKIIDMDSTYLLVSRSGLYELVPNSRSDSTSFDIRTVSQDSRFRDAVIDTVNNLVWIGSRDGLHHYKDGQLIHYERNISGLASRIQALELDQDGTLWMGTEDGLLHQRENGLIRYGSQEGLSNTLINDLYFDDEGILWVSTYGGGANVFLGEYVVNYDLSNTLSNNLVTSFIEKKNGDLWIGSYGGGVQILSKDFASFTTSSDTPSQLATSKWPVLQNLPDQRVYHLSQDPNGRTWIGMREALSYFRNDKVVTVEEEHFPYRKIRHIRWANSSTMWVSTYDHGLIKVEYTDLYSSETWSLTQFSTQIPTWPSNTVLKSIEDRNGTIWVATYAGVVELNQDGMIRTWGLAEGLPNVSVMGVMEDSQGSIWAHTFGGLAKISQNELVPITEKDGLPSRVCYFLYEDTQNSNLLWIGTNGGLIKYNVQDSTFKTITQEEGLISNEMNLGTFYEDSQGQFWLGTVEGLSKFDPKRYRGNEVSPRVHIEEVLLSGVNVNPLTTEKLRTDFNQNFFEVAFIGLNYTAPDQLYYRYRLAGLEEQWQQTKNTSLRYSSLPSGDYTFQVQSLNSNGLVSQEIAEVRFKVKPPIYQNIWFWTGIIMLIAWVLYLIRRTAMVTKLVDMERMRVRIASDLHDDVGASLTEIALQSDFLLAGTVQRELKDSLTQIGRQCRKIVGSLDDIVWSIDARNDSLGDLTDRIQDYALGVLDLMQFDIEYAFDSLPMEKKIPVEIRENTYLITKEALNNVVKYSNGDRVVIRLTLEEHTLNAVVSDNGYAITNSKKTGHGLRNMEMRAQRMNGILTIDNKDGFSVSLQVPLSN